MPTASGTTPTPSSSRRTPTRRCALLADADGRRAARARRLRVLPQRDAAAHRRERPARPPAAPGPPGTTACPPARRADAPVQVSYWMNKLHDLDRAGRLPGHAQRRRLASTPPGAAPDGLRAPDLHAVLGGRPALAPGAQHGPHRVRGRLPRLGLPRGRLRAGRRGPRRASGRAGDRPAGRRPHRCGRRRSGGRRWRPPRSTTSGSRTPARPRCATRSSTAATCGWSTSTTSPPGGWSQGRPLPRLAPGPGPVRGGRPPRRPRRVASRPTWSRSPGCTGCDDVARVVMLASARTGPGRLSYVFNPLSTHWCYRADGSPGLPGRRGAQHLRRAARLPAAARRRRPGRGGQGLLRLAVLRRRRPLPDAVLGARPAAVDHHGPDARRDHPVHRHRAAAPPGRPPPPPCCRATLRQPFMSLRFSALIRLQGVKLWLRRLPVVPRPPHDPPAGVGTPTDPQRGRAAA